MSFPTDAAPGDLHAEPDGPTYIYRGNDRWDVYLDASDVDLSNYYTKAQSDAAFQPLAANLASWAELVPSAKQNALGFTPANKAGDTFTGNVTVAAASPSMRVNVTGDVGYFGTFRNGLARWLILQTNETESGSNTGTGLSLTAYNDAGSPLGDVWNVVRSTQILNFAKWPTVAGGPIVTAKAWVNFDGTGTVAIRESHNVSSITDNGTGDYTVNFTSALPHANYCAVATAGGNGNRAYIAQIESPTTSSVTVLTSANNAAAMDVAIVGISIFG